MAGLKKIVLKNATQMSLHERFTYLRHHPSRPEESIQTVRANIALQHQASARNRRLAAQMERRPAVMAALKIKQKTLRQRLGSNRPSVTDRLTLTRVPISQRVMTQTVPLRSQSLPRTPRGSRARLTVGVRGRVFRTQAQFSPGRQLRGARVNVRQRGNLSRSQSATNLTRSQSTGNLNTVGRFQNQISNRQYQSQTRFNPSNRGVQHRVQRGAIRGNRGFNPQRSFRGGRAQGSFRGQFKQQQIPQQQQQRSRGNRGSFRRGSRGAGMRGRGRGRGRGRSQSAPPSKEELDMQLDQYMASTRSTLDKELDSYMNEGA